MDKNEKKINSTSHFKRLNIKNIFIGFILILYVCS